jgi:sodium-dependent dicarboxylate transporter 2/3/5
MNEHERNDEIGAASGTTPYALAWRDFLFISLALLGLILAYAAPAAEGLTRDGQIMLGILFMAAVLWITTPIPIAVTGLLVMIVQPLLQVTTAERVFSAFGNQAVFFLIGAFILASAMEKYGLHRRIALRFLRFFETSPRFFTLGIMVSSACISFIMPEHGVVALFLPIVVSVLVAMRVIPKQSNFGKVSVLCIAYGCSIGSLGTPVGGARNPLTIGILADAGVTVTFFDWMTYAMPVVFIALPLVWAILHAAFPLEIADISRAKNEIERQVQNMGAMNHREWTVAGIIAVTVVLWVFFSPQYLGLAVIALIGSILLFFTGSLSWKDVEERVPWGIILLYGGAITLGVSMKETGAASWITEGVVQIVGSNPYGIILVLILLTIVMTNFVSNTAAVAMLLPIGFAIATEIPGVSPLFAAMAIALSGGLAFVLVIATPGNAITYSSGYFSVRDLLRAGVIANLACVVVLFLVAVVYWEGVLGI